MTAAAALGCAQKCAGHAPYARSRLAETATLIRSDAAARTSTWGMLKQPDISGYLVIGAVLAVAVISLALVFTVNRYLLLLLAPMFYCSTPVPSSWTSRGYSAPGDIGADLLRMPTPGHLALLFAPPLLLACGGILTGLLPPRPRAATPAGREA